VRGRTGSWNAFPRLSNSNWFAPNSSYPFSVSVAGPSLMTGLASDFADGSCCDPIGAAQAYELPGTQWISSPVAETVLSDSGMESFQWTSDPLVENWWLYIGSSIGSRNYFDSRNLSSDVTTVQVSDLPQDGSTVYARLWYKVSGLWSFVDTAYVSPVVPISLVPDITLPAPDTTLESSSQLFEWSDISTNGAAEYWLYIGDAFGSSRYFNSGNLGSGTSVQVDGLPTDGSTLYASLYWREQAGVGDWQRNDHQYMAVTATDPDIVSPVPGSTFGGGTVNFHWSGGVAPVRAYWLYIGSSAGGAQYHNSGNLGANPDFPYMVEGLPTDASTVYVRLWHQLEGSNTWLYTDFTYTAFSDSNAVPAPATPLAPIGSGASTTPTYSWSDISNSTWFLLWVNNADGVNVVNQWYRRSDANCNGTSCSVVPTTEISGSARWWVRTWNRAGNGSWSTSAEFSP